MALHRSIVGFLDSVGMWAQVQLCWDLAYQLQIEVDEKGKVEVRPL